MKTDTQCTWERLHNNFRKRREVKKKGLMLIIITLMCLESTGCVGTVKNLTRLIREVQTEERKTEAKQEEEHQAAENKKEENYANQAEEKSNIKVEDHYVLVRKVDIYVSENEAREQTDYFYDEYGNLIREEYIDLTDSNYYGNKVYTYDSSHRLINWTSEGNWHEYNNSCDYVYDTNGNLIEWKSSRNSITETYTYDANGNMIEEFRDCSNYYLSDMKYEYTYMLLSEHVSE